MKNPEEKISCAKEPFGISFVPPNENAQLFLPDQNCDRIALIDNEGCSFWIPEFENGTLSKDGESMIKREDILKVKIVPGSGEVLLSYRRKRIIEVFDPVSLKRKFSLTHESMVEDLKWFSPMQRVISCDDHGFWYTWNFEEGKITDSKSVPRIFNEPDEFISNKNQPLEEIFISPSGQFFFTLAHHAYKNPYSVWKLQSGEIVHAFNERRFKLTKPIGAISFAGFTNEETLLSFYNHNNAVWRPATDDRCPKSELFFYHFPDQKIKTKAFPGRTLCVSPDCRFVLYKNFSEGTLHIFNIESNSEFQLAKGLAVEKAGFSENGNFLFLETNEKFYLGKVEIK